MPYSVFEKLGLNVAADTVDGIYGVFGNLGFVNDQFVVFIHMSLEEATFVSVGTPISQLLSMDVS